MDDANRRGLLPLRRSYTGAPYFSAMASARLGMFLPLLLLFSGPHFSLLSLSADWTLYFTKKPILGCDMVSCRPERPSTYNIKETQLT
jgi:hypothetical protein